MSSESPRWGLRGLGLLRCALLAGAREAGRSGRAARSFRRLGCARYCRRCRRTFLILDLPSATEHFGKDLANDRRVVRLRHTSTQDR